MSFSELAAEAGIPPRVLAAIAAIESGHSPRAVRFERRLFLARGGSTDGLPRGTGRSVVDVALARAPRAAVESTSWGTYQVLGGHLLRLYGPEPLSAVAEFDASPALVSERLLVSWFQASPAARTAANALDLDRLARLYNGAVDPDGPGPLSSRWATRLRAAYSSAREK